MARGVFGFGPSGEVPGAEPEDPKAAAESLAVTTGLPPNLVMALREAGGDVDGVAAAVKSGQPVDKAVEAITGDPAKASALMNRAFDIADQLYPRPTEPKTGSFVGDAARQLGGSLVKGAGSLVKGLGLAADEATNAALGYPDDAAPTWAKQGADALGEVVQDYGQSIQDGVSDEGRKALQDSSPGGDLFDPSTWTFGEKPSLRGYAMLATDVLGSFLPVVATALLTRSPAATAAVGGAMGGGAGAQQAEEIIDQMAATKTEDGRTELEVNSAFYREALARGASPEDALKRTKEAAARMAFLMTAPVSAFGGAATERILGPVAKGLAARGVATRVAGTAGLSAIEEGVQEVAESAATRAGVNEAAGTDLSLTEGTFGDFLLGALGGSVPGAAVGAFAAPPRDEQDPGTDGSGVGQAAAPNPLPPGGGVAADQPDMGMPIPEPAPAPTGPLSRAAAAAPDLTPPPEMPEQPPRFPDQKPGKSVRVQDPQGRVWDAVFQRETPEGGAVLRIAGEEITLDAVEFDGAVLNARLADEKAKMEATGKTVPDKAPTATPDDLARPPLQPGGLAAQAQAGIAPPAAPYAPEPAPKPGKAKVPPYAPQPTKPDVVNSAGDLTQGLGDFGKGIAEGLYDMLFAAYEKGSLKDASGTADPILKVAKRVKEAGGALTRETFKPFAQEVAAVMERPPADRAKLMNDIVKTYAGVKPDAAKKDEATGAAFAAPADDAGGAGPAGTVEGVQPVAGQGDAQPDVEGGLRGEQQPGGAPDGEAGAGDVAQPVDQTALTEAKPKAPGAMERGKVGMMLAAGQQVLTNTGRATTPFPKLGADTERKTANMVKRVESWLMQNAVAEATARGDDFNARMFEANKGKPSQSDKDSAEAYLFDPDFGPDRIKPVPSAGKPLNGPAPDPAPAALTEEAAVAALQAAVDARDALHDRYEAETDEDAKKKFFAELYERTAAGASDAAKALAGVVGKDRAEEIFAAMDQASEDRRAKAAPAPDPVTAAAAEADPDPTPAQAEAGNYRKGHVAWNGLDLTIENAKGSERRGTAADGTEWSVTMPAHYGYIRRTVAADEEQMDFYMGPRPDSDVVVVVDQVDAETRAWDEHKVMLGFRNRKAALDHYVLGFSDGKGKDRLGGHKIMTVAEFKEWLADGDLKKPVSDAVKAKRVEPVAKEPETPTPAPVEPQPAPQPEPTPAPLDHAAVEAPAGGELQSATGGAVPAPKGLKNLTEAENAELAALEAEFLDLLKNQTNSGLDPKMLAIAFKIGTLYVKAGTRRFRGMIDTMMQRLGLTLEQAQPYARNAYNQIRDDLELAGEDVRDMDTAAEVVTEIRKMRAATAKTEAQGSTTAEEGGTMEPAAAPPDGNNTETGDDAGRDGGRGDAGLDNGTPGEGGTVEPGGPAGAGDGGRGDGDGRGGEPRDSGAGSPDGDAGRLSIPAAPPGDGQGLTRSGVSPGNFEITDDFGLGEGTPKQKIDGNLAAIRLVKDLDRLNRYPTRDEQAILARYVGWGGLKGVFDGKNTGKTDMWGRAQADLKKLLTPDEYQNALFSVPNAHYTAKPVVDAMWRAMRHFGFEGGRALEPTVGTGNFLGAQPQDLAAKTEWFASELDPVTSSIAAYLYPKATVLRATGFEKAPFRDGAFDIAIGNPPFGAETIRDKDRPDISGLSLHNYIIAKTGKHLRPGGIMAMVVTHRFLDTPNPQARNVLAKQFRFMGAVRLPSDAFLKNAGTEVTTDIVFFQKLAEGEKRDADPAWLDTNGRLPGDIRVNRYFAENPQNILGRSAMDGTMYGAAATDGEYTVHSDGRDLSSAIDEAVQKSMPADALGSRAHALEAAIAAEDTSGLPIGGMQMLPNGRIIRREMDRGISEITADSHWSEGAEEWDRLTKALTALRDMLRKGTASPAEFVETQDAFFAAKEVAYRKGGRRAASPTEAEQAVYDIEDGLRRGDGAWEFDAQLAEIKKASDNRKLGDTRFARLKGLLDLRRQTQALIRAEFADASDIEAMRTALNKAYDAFVAKHGFVNAGANVSVLRGDTGAELGLEAEYSEALKETVNGKTTVIEPETAKKSRILSARVNRPKKDISAASSPEDALLVSMQERGRVDLGYMAALLQAKGMGPEAIRDALSAGDEPRIYLDPEKDEWTDAEHYLSGNIKDKLDAAKRAGLTVNMRALEKAMPAPLTRERIVPAIRSQWIPAEVFEAFLKDLGIDRPKINIITKAGMVTVDGMARQMPTDYGRQFQHSRADILKIFTAAVNGKSLTIYDRIDSKTTVKNEEATKEVNAIMSRMGKEFQAWAYSDAERADAIVKAFNEKVNVFRRRTYDGERYLRPVGANTGPGGFQLRRTQKNGAWRLIQEDRALLDHVVGAGEAQPLDAKVLTPHGWVRMGDIRVGDEVIAQDGTPARVTGVFPQGEKPIFRVTMSDGSATECCDEHLWFTQTYRERGYAQRGARLGKTWLCGQGKVRTLSEVMASIRSDHLGVLNHSIPVVEPVQFAAREVPVDPWLLGVLIGDGCMRHRSVSVSTVDPEIVQRVKAALPEGCFLKHISRCDYRINFGGKVSSRVAGGGYVVSHPVRRALIDLDLDGKLSFEKRIPEAYLVNSAEVRLAMLRGLMDTDGTVNKRGTHVSFCTTSPGLVEDVEFLVRSLGGVTRRTQKNVADYRTAFMLTITMPPEINPFWLARKADLVRPKSKYAPARYIASVEPVGAKQAQCISIDHPSHLYVTDDFIVTHNTLTVVQGVMERRRLGLTRKALLAVPNHLVLQWAREWLQFYPGARLLAATKDDFEGPNRRRLFARMATGDYDAIIIGHSSLGFIAPPQQDVVDLMTAQVQDMQDALDQAKRDGTSKRTMNQLATKLKKYRERLQTLLEKPRDTLGFDLAEMGVDYLAADEAHEFKNLEYATGAERLVGMNNPNGSKRAFDLLVKVRGIQKRGGATHFATGTPVSNSLVEAYAMMKYLAWEEMEKLGVSNFDAWSAYFVQAETRFEYTATQKLKERNVMSGLVNLGPLADLYRGFADVIDRQDLERIYAEQIREQNLERKAKGLPLLSERFPTPHVKDGGRRLLSAPPSSMQELATDYYVARMAAIKKNASNKEYAKIDNPLWVLSDARKSSLDIRLLKAAAGQPRAENSKVSRSAREIKRIYDKWSAVKGTQLVFSDLSTPSKAAEKSAGKTIRDLLGEVFGEEEGKAKAKAMAGTAYTDQWAEAVEAASAALDDPLTDDDVRERIEEFLAENEDAEGVMMTADTGFSVYDDLRAALVESGIPEREIAFIHDYDTPAAKAKLFKKVNAGAIRVLLGSTPKMGAGTNVQERLVALHHIDSPWRPSDVEQREGRVIRQGNKLYEADPDGFEVEILAYSTTGTSDVVLWQVLERKARSIGMFKAGAVDRLDEGNGDADSYAEFMATSTGNPVFRLKMQTEKALLEEGSKISGALLAKSSAQAFLRGFDRSKADLEAAVARIEKMRPTALDYQGIGGPADEFKAALDQAKAKYDTEMAAFDAFRAKVEARKIELAATGLTEGKVRAAITKEFGEEAQENQRPKKPGPLSDEVTKASGYARAMKKMLADVDATVSDGQRAARLPDGTEITINHASRTSTKHERLLQITYRPAGQTNPRFIDSTYAINASGSARILSYLMPDAIGEVRAEWLDTAKGRIKAMETAKPDQERLASLDVDTTTREEIRDTLDFYALEVRLAEAKADVDRAKRGENIFIMSDTARPLDEMGSIAVNAAPTFAIDGDVWTGTGLGAQMREIGESPALFEVTSEKTGQRALVVARKEGTGWVSERLVKPTPRAIREMQAAKESRFGRAASNTITGQDIRPLTTALTTEMRRHGLAGRITPVLVRSLINEAGIPIAGRQQGATITVSAESGDVAGVMRHEIIHVLRDARLWDKPYGLFAEAEWKALVRAARSDKALMQRVDAAYPDLPTAAKTEEAVAEMYRQWAAGREIEGPVLRILGKIRRFLRAMAAALRGVGFTDAALVMERISRGEVGGRGPDGPQGPGGKPKDARAPAATAEPKEMRLDLLRGRTKAIVGQQWKKTEGSYWSDLLTTAMAGSGGWNTLALVPGRALFAELGKNLLAAKAYLRGKEEMDALRNQWHARADETAQEWMTLRRKDPRANDELMDIMHQTTLDGIDPSKPDTWEHAMAGPAERNIERLGDKADQWAIDTMRQVRQRRATYATLKERYDALPKDFQNMYRKVRVEYDVLANDFEKAVIENIATGMEIATKRAERTYLREMERIRDEGLEGDEKKAGEATAKEKLDATKQRGGWAGKARMAALRQSFESNRLKGPYFPLARFGEFFVTERDSKGAVVSFSRFETAREQRDYAAEAEARNPGRVQTGVMSNKDEIKGSVDPRFVADVEAMLSEAGAGPDVMDAVWQRWLETLPDRSIRNSRIHRKGREGFSKDAFRAFGKHMFHGAHQLAKLKFGLILEEHLNDAEDEARRADDPSRAGLVVNEMRRRHDFTMNPTGSAAVASLSSLAFIWYLGATPAAAIANISQTTVVGIPVMAARFQKAGVTGAVRALTRAARDFAQGRGSIENAKGLTADEVLAMKEALRRGTIDKTQAHDLASVAETGIEYNAAREKVMRLIGFMFHHAERFNREVTFMASYRLARAEGMSHADAIDAGTDVTWKSHYDYSNTSRPRIMQSDLGKILTMFRNFTVNTLWRLFRDTHQALTGATAEERREARTQLIGITLSMFAHAGIKGVWGYGLLMMFLGIFFPGGSDEAEEKLQDALLLEGDGAGTAAWNWIMGAALSGVPGHVTGTDLTERIGMPNLWFRGVNRDLEGEDLYAHYVGEVLGPVFGIGEGIFRGVSMMADGEIWRGAEAAIPKVVRDLMKSYRFATDGAETLRGDPIIEEMSPWQIILQMNGFTPAQLAERYEINNRLKNEEARIMDERKSIHRAVGDTLRAGEPVSQTLLDRIRDFNARFPEYPITATTIKQSVQGQIRSSERNEFGIVLNPRLNDRLRSELAPSIYN